MAGVLGGLLMAAEPADGIFEATGRDPFFQGKTGFARMSQARDHAFRAFHKEAKAGRITPAVGEYACWFYEYTDGSGRKRRFLHGPWLPAEPLAGGQGERRFQVRNPVPSSERIQVYSLMHSHPAGGSQVPSRSDLLLASKFRRPDGSFRLLYLITPTGRLVKIKARRDFNLAPQGLPAAGRYRVDWAD